MLRNSVLVLACLWSGLAFAEQVVPLAIGGTPIRVAVDDGYVRSSAVLPTSYAVAAAAVPPANRLVESFVTLADAKRIALGQPQHDPLLQVQVLRNAEALAFSDADWQQAKPAIATAVGGLDMKKTMDGMQAGAGQRISRALGSTVAVDFGDMNQPVLYADDARSLRFVMLVPATVTANGVAHPVSVECAGAIARVGDKLLFLYAYRRHEPNADTAIVRAALDHFVDRSIALEQGPATSTAVPVVESTP